jgi:cytochrome b561
MLKSVRPFVIKVHRDRYSTVAIAFHWLIAGAIVLQLALGWHMGDVEGLGRSILLQIHRSVGVSILVLTLARTLWRVPCGAWSARRRRTARICTDWKSSRRTGCIWASTPP